VCCSTVLALPNERPYTCHVHFRKESVFPVPVAALWAFHAHPDAFARLTPPWQDTEVIQAPASLKVGTIVRLRVKVPLLPIWQTIEAEHIEYQEGHLFVDRMNKGPFAQWVHRHEMTAEGASASRLVDSIEYTLPLGALGRTFGSAIARRELEKLFAFRHQTTLHYLTTALL
jgi:ligand-binding SRPBCC domain-containing protein